MAPEYEDATNQTKTADVSGYAGQLTMQTMLDIAAGVIVIVKVRREDPSVGLAHIALVRGANGRLQLLCDKFPGTVLGLVPATHPMPLCYNCQRVQAGYIPPEDPVKLSADI